MSKTKTETMGTGNRKAVSAQDSGWSWMRDEVMPRALDAPQAAGDVSLQVTAATMTVRTWMISKLMPKPAGGVAEAPYEGLTSKLDWTPIAATAPGDFIGVHDHTGYADGRIFFKANDRVGDADGILYFANRFHLPQPGIWGLRLGYDGGVRVFVDGETVLIDPETRNPAIPGRTCVQTPLVMGEHEVVIAFDTAAGKGWGIFFAWVSPEMALRLPAPTLQ